VEDLVAVDVVEAGADVARHRQDGLIAELGVQVVGEAATGQGHVTD
jgi:hypothetical protein